MCSVRGRQSAWIEALLDVSISFPFFYCEVRYDELREEVCG